MPCVNSAYELTACVIDLLNKTGFEIVLLSCDRDETRLICTTYVCLHSTGLRGSNSRRDFLTKYDRKYLVFGEKTEEEPK